MNLKLLQKKEKKIIKVKINRETKKLKLVKLKSNLVWLFVTIILSIIILPTLFLGTYLAESFIQHYNINEEKLPKTLVKTGKLNYQIINKNTHLGRVASAETEKTKIKNSSFSQIHGRVLASENYKINTINLGGSVAIISRQQNVSLEIKNIKSKSFINSKENKAYLVISWTTNKVAISQLEYSKNNGQDPQVIKENSYGFNHSIVISDLNPGTSYVYQIESTDQWGNSQISKYFGIYTASNPLSVFDLISNAMSEIFGWAIKK